MTNNAKRGTTRARKIALGKKSPTVDLFSGVDSASVLPVVAQGNSKQAIAERRERAYAMWAFDPHHNTRMVAKAVGVSRTTIENWARMEGWRERYARDHADMLAGMREYGQVRMMELLTEAMETVGEIIRNPQSSDRDRTLASKIVIDHMMPERLEVSASVSSLNQTVVQLMQSATGSQQDQILKGAIEQNMIDAESSPVRRR